MEENEKLGNDHIKREVKDYNGFKLALEKRTLTFSTNVINALAKLHYREVTKGIISQLSRSATSISANYCEANHSESRQDFVHKMHIVTKEASETRHWLILVDSLDFLAPDEKLLFQPLRKESQELYALFITILRNARENAKNA